MSSGGTLRGLLARRARAEVPTDPSRVVVGPVRLGKRTKDLVKRLELGEIAIIDHADLDRIAAEDLAVSGVVRSSTSPASPPIAIRTSAR